MLVYCWMRLLLNMEDNDNSEQDGTQEDIYLMKDFVHLKFSTPYVDTVVNGKIIDTIEDIHKYGNQLFGTIWWLINKPGGDYGVNTWGNNTSGPDIKVYDRSDLNFKINVDLIKNMEIVSKPVVTDDTKM